MVYHYPEIDCEWDGAVCATMEKMLDYISRHYHIGCVAPADLSVA